jgi:LacI family transcriptional regulator
VSADDEAGAEMATEHLVGLGHRRIAYFADPTVEDTADHDRRRGYGRVMERSGLRSAVFHWQRQPGELLRQRRDEQVAQLMRDSFTAVFSSNDYGAIELLECADRLGVRVPDDLAVVGFDDVVMSGLARIGLTTVRQPQMELAGIAVEMLAGRINGEIEGPPQRRTLEVELVIRGSSAPAAT